MQNRASLSRANDTTPTMAVDVLREEDVLKPAPQNEDPDDWPCHILRQAAIFSQDGKSMVNLLEAELHGPFVVQGKLEVEKQYKSQLLFNPRGRIVELSSDLFSIGDGPDGQVTIWAGGRGGWFEINPSASYQDEYENMAVGVKLYYSILDYITDAKQSRKNTLDIDKIFDAYSVKEHDSTLNREDVAELCRIHGVFLLSMMRRPAAAKEWKSTPIFKWLVQELPDIIPQLDSSSGRRASRGTQIKEPNVGETTPPPETTIAPMNSKQAKIIVEKMEEAHEEGRNRRQDMTIASLGKIIYEDFNIPSVVDAKELIRLHAEAIRSLLSRDWVKSPIYAKLDVFGNSPRKAACSSEILELELHPREKKSNPTLPIRPNHGVSLGDEVGQTQSREGSNMRLSAKGSGKTTPIKTDIRLRGSRRSGKGASLRLATPGKHPRSDIPSDDSEDEPLRTKKRRRGMTINLDKDEDDEDEDTPMDEAPEDEDADEDEDEENDQQNEEEPEPEPENDIDMEEQLQLSLESINIPSFEPIGPDGLWKCPRKGCKYFVHGVEDEAVQEGIRKHFLKHADNIKAQLARFKTVKQESRPHLPINHLLEKLRSLGEASRLREEAEEERIEGKVVPKLIKRKMPI